MWCAWHSSDKYDTHGKCDTHDTYGSQGKHDTLDKYICTSGKYNTCDKCLLCASPYNDKYKVGKYGTHDKYVMFRPV